MVVIEFRKQADSVTGKAAPAGRHMLIAWARFRIDVILHVLLRKDKKMSKSQDAKKAVKKEPAKTMKEKKAAKKIKKEEKKRQQ
ncbi:MAG: hypothetical protein HYS18_12020 [Burkholderiales bacterium]|nr:hypothetical protein [Burkholderiales bacterium]